MTGPRLVSIVLSIRSISASQGLGLMEHSNLGLVKNQRVGMEHIAHEKPEDPVRSLRVRPHAELRTQHFIAHKKLSKGFTERGEVDLPTDFEGRRNPDGKPARVQAGLPFDQVVVKLLGERRTLGRLHCGCRRVMLRRRADYPFDHVSRWQIEFCDRQHFQGCSPRSPPSSPVRPMLPRGTAGVIGCGHGGFADLCRIFGEFGVRGISCRFAGPADRPRRSVLTSDRWR
jgi:hypothetical protein